MKKNSEFRNTCQVPLRVHTQVRIYKFIQVQYLTVYTQSDTPVLRFFKALTFA